MLRAYVLIQTDGGKDLVADEVREVPEVISADDVTGAYDVIAVAQSGSMQHLEEVVLPEILRVPGVMRALPAPLLDGQGGDRESGAPFRVSVASGQAA
jgi:DNA-binding Lrp family transcriptional regulator